MEQNKKNEGNGPLIASIIIISILLLGSYYTIKERPYKQEVSTDQISEQQIIDMGAQSTSTEIEDIEKDLEVTNLDGLMLDLDIAELELN